MPESDNQRPDGRGQRWIWALLALSIVTVCGSLALTLVAGLKPCPLCFYQRTFAMGVLGLVATGLVLKAPSGHLALGALPLIVGGFGVAVFHVYLEISNTLDCPPGLFGLATAPQQSFVMYVLLVAATAGGCLAARPGRGPLALALGLGLFFAVASCVSNGALPSTPNPTFDDQGRRVIVGCEPHWDESMPRPPAD